MPHIAVIDTVLPGLLVTRGLREVVHAGSGLTLLTLPAGLTRAEVSGYVHTPLHSPLRTPCLLSALVTQDWTGPLTGAHWAAVQQTAQHTRTQAQARVWLERQGRVLAGLRALNTLMSGERGQAMSAGYALLCRARSQREGAQTPAEKGEATRAHKKAVSALAGAGVSEAQIDRLMEASRARMIFDGLVRSGAEHQRLYAERDARIERGKRQAEAFLSRASRPAVRDLLTCVQLTSTAGTVQGAVYRKARDEEGRRSAHSLLHLANRERVRRQQGGWPLDPAHPEVREQTRAARVSQGVARLTGLPRQCAEGRAFLALCAKFTQAAQFRGSGPRQRRLQEAALELARTFPQPGKRRAVWRGLHRHVQAQAGTWGAAPYRPQELQAAAGEGVEALAFGA